jgi:hypothetical protein
VSKNSFEEHVRRAAEAAGSRTRELVVISPLNRDWTCRECSGSGDLLIMDGPVPLCLTCAEMDHLVYLPSGDAALTRRGRKASRLSAVVVRFSGARKRYERQGILVEEAALQQAESECLADKEARARRRTREERRRVEQDLGFQADLAAEILRLFPGCPGDRAAAIARHAGERGSGRIGRSAAGRALDAQAVRLAVVASVRHEDTDYDLQLMRGIPREMARERVASEVDGVLDGWRTPAG